jgi:hypothetical protein
LVSVLAGKKAQLGIGGFEGAGGLTRQLAMSILCSFRFAPIHDVLDEVRTSRY